MDRGLTDYQEDNKAMLNWGIWMAFAGMIAAVMVTVWGIVHIVFTFGRMGVLWIIGVWIYALITVVLIKVGSS